MNCEVFVQELCAELLFGKHLLFAIKNQKKHAFFYKELSGDFAESETTDQKEIDARVSPLVKTNILKH